MIKLVIKTKPYRKPFVWVVGWLEENGKALNGRYCDTMVHESHINYANKAIKRALT